jgi:hypothetical protein
MDHYPEVSVNERECRGSMPSSRHDSGNSVAKAVQQKQQHETERSSSYQSFPSPSVHSTHRSDSDSNHSNNESAQRIEAEYARYTDAPPPYSQKEYEGKDEEEQTHMRMTDYAKEISRMMGRQLVTGLKINEMEKGKGEEKAS